MQKRVIPYLVAAAMAVVWATPAEALTADVQVYLVNQELEISEAGFSAKEDDYGFGVRGRVFVTENLFVTGRFQRVELTDDDGSFDLDDLRIGLGWAHATSPKLTLFAKAEYVDLGSDAEQSGYGITAGLDWWVSPRFALRGELGYLDLDDLDGVELTVGGTFLFTQRVGAFGELRRWDASFNGASVDLTDIRVGVSLHF